MKCPFKPEDFIYVKEDLIKNVRQKGFGCISEYCVLTAIPLVIAYQFVIEEIPEHTDMCNKAIKNISDFYGYGS